MIQGPRRLDGTSVPIRVQLEPQTDMTNDELPCLHGLLLHRSEEQIDGDTGLTGCMGENGSNRCLRLLSRDLLGEPSHTKEGGEEHFNERI